MQVLFDPLQYNHEPRFFLVNGTKTENPEVAERARMLLRALQQEGHDVKNSENHGLGPVAAVHSPDYLKFLKNIYRRWQHIDGGSEEVIPNIHPNLSPGGYPDSAVGQAGWHMADTACPVGPDTWKSALASANTAVDAAIHLLTKGQTVYALCRPPGHHAFSSMAGGFCYLNNTAISAQQLRNEFERVTVIDVDLHHGNGTQEIFYQRADVLTVSIHADPVRFYPFFWGYADEHGKGQGRGRNLNLPLPRGTGDKTYLENLEQAVETHPLTKGCGQTLLSIQQSRSVRNRIAQSLSQVTFGRQVAIQKSSLRSGP